MPAPILEVRSISKRFPGVRALIEVSLALHPGEVLAVIGENGAGKSTLMKILAGVHGPDGGDILFKGQVVHLPTVRSAERLGIALIHQELNLADNLDIAGSIFLGREPQRLGFIRVGALEANAQRWLEQVGLRLPSNTVVGTLSLGRQQMVEIARALSADARVLIMDEPTSSLSQGETDQLYRVIKDLRARQVSVVYISHRLGEVKELADRVVVLRDGRNAGELSREQISHEAMVKLMVGRAIPRDLRRSGFQELGSPSSSYSGTETVLPGPAQFSFEIRALRTSTHPRFPLSFTVRPGEIVGIAGLVGAGRSELLRTLFGVDRAVGGEVWLGGRRLDLRSPNGAIRAGLALVPEDRKLQGVILEMAVGENTVLPSLDRLAPGGFRRPSKETELAETLTRRLGVKTPGLNQWVQFLSGGNQQKVVLAKWLALEPKVLLLDEPTRGIDVGAKQEIYRLMEELAGRGVMIVFASSEMEEVLRMSDRVIVMHQGRIQGELDSQALSEEAIMGLATGKASA